MRLRDSNFVSQFRPREEVCDRERPDGVCAMRKAATVGTAMRRIKPRALRERKSESRTRSGARTKDLAVRILLAKELRVAHGTIHEREPNHMVLP